MRYHGQGLVLTIDSSPKKVAKGVLADVAKRFDTIHEQMFTFALDHDQELVNLRAIVQGKPTSVRATELARGRGEPKDAVIQKTKIFADGKPRNAVIYDRGKLKAGHKIPGPAIIMEMDATTLILPGHYGSVDSVGNILIRPVS